MNKSIITFLCIILALGLGLGLIWPRYQGLLALRVDIEEKDAELQSKTDYFSQIKEVSKELERYKEEMVKISNALPLDPSLPSLFNFLQRSAAQTGLVLENISLGAIILPQAEKSAKGEQEPIRVREINANLSLAGSYSAFKDFLSAIEKSARLIEIRSVAFSSIEESEKPISFRVRIKTHSY